MQIDLNDAISYNSLIELKGVFGKRSSDHGRFGRGETALIACALKSRKVAIIMLMPDMPDGSDVDDGLFRADQIRCAESNAAKGARLARSASAGSSKYFVLKHISTEMKPTSLI